MSTPKAAVRRPRRDVHRERHQGPRGARGRPQAARDVHRGHGVSYGLHHLVFEVVDNSVDEALAGYCSNIRVILHADGSCTVIDDGRGIPVDVHIATGKSAAEVVLTTLHAGGKFESSVYKVSGGLHGVGVSVVNALSEWLEVEIRRDGRVYTQRYDRGKPQSDLQAGEKTTKRGTTIRFKPDPEIFEITTFSFDVLANRLRELAFLNKGLKIQIEDERDEKKVTFHYTGGIRQFVEYINQNKTAVHPKVLYFEGGRGDIQVEVAAPVQRRLPGVRLLVREQHQHARGGTPTSRASGRPSRGRSAPTRRRTDT